MIWLRFILILVYVLPKSAPWFIPKEHDLRVFPEEGKSGWRKKGAFGLDEVQLEDPRALDLATTGHRTEKPRLLESAASCCPSLWRAPMIPPRREDGTGDSGQQAPPVSRPFRGSSLTQRVPWQGWWNRREEVMHPSGVAAGLPSPLPSPSPSDKLLALIARHP